ncbi:MAG: class I SAM-dependent methyltransferase [Patescibacteria group bacterium]|nr:class I SAM-dependent methyltransferase [Patescibacteria group bacterium]
MDRDETKTTISTYDNFAKDYARHRFFHPKNIGRDLLYFIKKNKKGRILDAGCGAGHDSVLFVSKGFDVIGIDLSEKMLREAKKKLPSAIFKKMDIRKLFFPRNYFTGIWMSASFLHIPKIYSQQTLIEMHRVLKSGGLLYINAEKGADEKIILKKEYSNKPRLISFYYSTELRKKIAKAGFKIIKERTDGDFYGWIRVFARK